VPAMKPFRWPPDKNELLKAERGISFEDITVAVEAGALLDVVPHPKPKQYPRQKIMVVEVFGYAYLVPFVEEEDHFFLKTIIPSRKATRDFMNLKCSKPTTLASSSPVRGRPNFSACVPPRAPPLSKTNV
jgi:hypothetical protein